MMDTRLATEKERLDKQGYLAIPVSPSIDLKTAIKKLKSEKNCIILAHYYQIPEIQDVADFVGDSLGLAQEANKTGASMILFAGVHFMAETAKILNPNKKVILPDLKAGCSLAESCSAEDLASFKRKHSDHLVVTYINTSAAVKVHSDIVCTSSNAEKIINSIPKDRKIIFAPDKNLGKYIIEKTGREMILWDGACIVHEAFSIDKLLELKQKHPDAVIIAHPESEPHLLKVATYIGSTAGMIRYIKTSIETKFIVATEAGILYEMRKQVKNKELIPAPAKQDNTCACSECGYMKMNTLQKVYNCLKYELPEIHIPEEIRVKAKIPIDRMLTLS